MIRTLNFILVLTSILGLVAVYGLKFSVEETASSKFALERTIEAQEAELSLLKADWSFLNQPGHIAPIVQRHEAALALVRIDQKQFGSFNDIPMRPAEPDTDALDELFQLLNAGIDPIDQILEQILEE
ncbi:hypothetical protein EMQ25_03965 [Arsenicitalea aurantiaca]|uniref:Cell division protein FtsL n=1 Tax=Arsenicitalea aurantiaca TaxID=1783274 RepID=A0A433XM00_9HYPH|nr:hypothetical protein [Arsenicitalea aurantiaca]RUT35115.1 hypothetical protein EMQ25_03965 [Arsenicitalea aurantiaca]